MKDRRSTSHGPCLPASFRLQGLVTLLAVCSLRARVGLFSCRRRSWDSPFGVFPSRKVARRSRRTRTHLPFLPSAAPGAKHQAGTPDRGSWALSFPRVPDARCGFKASTAGYSLGVRPFQGSPSKTLAGISPSLLSRAFRTAERIHGQRRLRVSISLRLAASARFTGVWQTGTATL
jgi:hypothetical protein